MDLSSRLETYRVILSKVAEIVEEKWSIPRIDLISIRIGIKPIWLEVEFEKDPSFPPEMRIKVLVDYSFEGEFYKKEGILRSPLETKGPLREYSIWFPLEIREIWSRRGIVFLERPREIPSGKDWSVRARKSLFTTGNLIGRVCYRRTSSRFTIIDKLLLEVTEAPVNTMYRALASLLIMEPHSR